MWQPRSSHGPSAAQRLVMLLVCASCSVDERTLTTHSVGSAGGEASMVDPLLGGAGGAAGDSSLPRCFYAGSSVASGCETLVANPGFAANVAGWTAEPLGISEGWVNADASGEPGSGSLTVTNTNSSKDEAAMKGIAGGAARQCISVSGGAAYDLAADIFIPSGQGMGFDAGATYLSFAMLSVFFYKSPGCDTQNIGNFTSDAVQVSDQWVHVEGATVAPRDSQAMAVRLATLKPFPQYMFEAHFDNVFVKERGAP